MTTKSCKFIGASLSSPVLLGLRFALHGCEKGGGQLALLPHLKARIAHFDVDDGEILKSKLEVIILTAT